MLFSSLLDRVSSAHCAVATPADWAQGRATFGGLTAAKMLTAMYHAMGEQRTVRTLAITFVGPIKPALLEIEARVLRRGNSVTLVEGRGLQDGEVKIIVQGSFAEGRESVIEIPAEPAPVAKPLSECIEMPVIPGLTPEFTRHFNYAYAWGGLPLSGIQSKTLGGYIRFRQREPQLTEAHVLGLVDAWPPATLPWVKKPTAASSLSWFIQFVQPRPTLNPEEYCLYQAVIEEAMMGYAHTRAKLWNSAGELVALSQQTVTVFA